MIARISTLLETSTDRAWGAVKKSATFLHVARGVLGLGDAHQLPEEWHEGDVVRTRMYLFHVLPGWIHELRIARVDDRRRELYTNERGGLVSAWNHRIRVEPAPGDRCRYTDEIEIHAGPMTPVIWVIVHLFFRYRQRRWRRLARGLS